MSTINVLLLATDAERQSDWNHWLDRSKLRVWQGSENISPTIQPDIVVSDTPRLPRNAPAGAQLQDRTQFGLILVGCPSAEIQADVNLPADVTGRELQLACQLLGELVQQRRRQQSRAGELRLLEQWAFRDTLTGLANRRAWDQQMKQLSPVGAPLAKPVCLAILDVDDFKITNDSHGHDAGDTVLQAAAGGLRSALRQSDLAARWGGDEFALFLPNVPPQQAHSVVERIRTAADQQIVEQTGQPITLSAGLRGIAAGTTFQAGALWQQADTALLKAKQSGGCCSVEYNPSVSQPD